MEKIIRFIVEKKLLICIIFCVLIAASAACIPFVRVNYDDTSYLPKNSETKQALEYLYDQYGSGGNASIMFDDVDIEGALEYKERLEKIDGIKKVLWLDDVLAGFLDDVVAQMNEEGTAITKAEAIEYLLGTIGVIKLDNRGVNYPRFIGVLLTKFMEGGLSMGLMGEFKPQLEGFYRQDAAFMQIFFTEGDYADATYKAINEIRKMGVSLYMTGNAAVNYNSRKMVSNETMISTIIASSVVLIILFLMTKSYWEPVIYLMTIGSAVIINMGTNIFMGGISYMTQGVASVLQLALTMDYSIFLLNRYRREKKSGLDNNEAMISAIKHSLTPISASSLTTIASFVALMFMSYRLGLDIGLVLTKGVVISMLSVFMFMPALILYTDKLITKSAHKSFRFTFKKLSAGLVKSRYVLPFIIIAIMAPCAYFQSQNLFVYGNEATMGSEGSLIAADREAVEGIFGTQNQMLIILPDGANAKEYDISMKLLELEYMGISSVQSLSLVREAGLEDVLPPVLKNQFIGKSSTRIILSLSIPSEGEQTEKLVDTIRGILDEELKDTEVSGGDKYYLVGEASATMEIKSLVERDYDIITYVSLALVGLVILVSFKSAIIPVILLLVIQGSVYINMTIPYLTKEPIIFVGYLLVSSILLGATIDYAILFTDNYMSNRQTMNKFDSARFAMSQSARSLITSAGILTFSGLTLWVISGMPASSLFGAAIFRGGLLAFICVMILLPQLLMLLDTPIRYSTWKGKEKMIRSRDATPMDTRNITDEQ